MCQVSKLSKANKHRYHRIPSLSLKYSLALVWGAYLPPQKTCVSFLQGVKFGISKTLKFLMHRSFVQKRIILSSASCNKYRADFLQVVPWADFLSPICSCALHRRVSADGARWESVTQPPSYVMKGKGKKKKKLAYSRRQQLRLSDKPAEFLFHCLFLQMLLWFYRSQSLRRCCSWSSTRPKSSTGLRRRWPPGTAVTSIRWCGGPSDSSVSRFLMSRNIQPYSSSDRTGCFGLRMLVLVPTATIGFATWLLLYLD